MEKSVRKRRKMRLASPALSTRKVRRTCPPPFKEREAEVCKSALNSLSMQQGLPKDNRTSSSLAMEEKDKMPSLTGRLKK